MDKAELSPAFTWSCPKCSAANVCYPVVAELSAQERSELEEYGEPTDPGRYSVIPPEVNCARCGGEFETVDARSPGASDETT